MHLRLESMCSGIDKQGYSYKSRRHASSLGIFVVRNWQIIIRAALTRPRTIPGCDDALKILERHAELIGVDGLVKDLHKDMCAAALDVLSHDHSIANKEPTPTESLVAV